MVRHLRSTAFLAVAATLGALVQTHASFLDIGFGLNYSNGNFLPYGGFPYGGIANTIGGGAFGGFGGGMIGGYPMGYGMSGPFGSGGGAYGPQGTFLNYFPWARSTDAFSAGQLNYIGMNPSDWAPLFQPNVTMQYPDGTIVQSGMDDDTREILALGMAAQPMSVVPMRPANPLPDVTINNNYHSSYPSYHYSPSFPYTPPTPWPPGPPPVGCVPPDPACTPTPPTPGVPTPPGGSLPPGVGGGIPTL